MTSSFRAAAAADTGPLMPGQVVRVPKKRHALTLEQRVWAAAVEGRGIRQVVKALEDSKVNFRVSDLEVMSDSLEEQILDRRDLQEELKRMAEGREGER
jgi:hypothetical protein